MVTLARNRAQLVRAEQAVTSARDWGFTEDELRLLDRDEARAIVSGTDVLGGVYTPHCAAIHPARLVRGLADVVKRRGVTIYEVTTVREIHPRKARTDRWDGPSGNRGPSHRGFTTSPDSTARCCRSTR